MFCIMQTAAESHNLIYEQVCYHHVSHCYPIANGFILVWPYKGRCAHIARTRGTVII